MPLQPQGPNLKQQLLELANQRQPLQPVEQRQDRQPAQPPA